MFDKNKVICVYFTWNQPVAARHFRYYLYNPVAEREGLARDEPRALRRRQY